jgi:hypothetical protein
MGEIAYVSLISKRHGDNRAGFDLTIPAFADPAAKRPG